MVHISNLTIMLLIKTNIVSSLLGKSCIPSLNMIKEDAHTSNIIVNDILKTRLTPIEDEEPNFQIMSNLVSHGNYKGFIDTNGSATCTDCKKQKKNDNFMF